MTQQAPLRGSDVLELPKVKPSKGDGDADRFAHFVRKDRANQAAITGQAVVALCGKVWVPTRDAKKYPVCPRCKALRDEVGNQGKNWPFAD
ncbi:DUF3039 domain-containing protein [Actinomyces minihominis]|uniref:DUF3039 domain-containing protein n=1 Tax=Actinomyces minihominis TaxID=2002838 RepID=UPI000C06E4A8|nr:DUF3039 domain-containing protein [Actinomyces minihominis]